VGREEGSHGVTTRRLIYDAECARALAVAVGRAKRHKLGRVRIFSDAQAAITRMTHDEPGPGQTCHPGEASDSDPPQAITRHRDRDTLVPSPQRAAVISDKSANRKFDVVCCGTLARRIKKINLA